VTLGIATGMVIAGLTARFHTTFRESGGSSSAVAGAALLALAVGVRVPHRFAVSVCAAAWRRFIRRGTGSQLSSALIRPGVPDRALSWLVLAVIALFAGVSTALLPLSVSASDAAYEWMREHFLWSPTPLAVLQIVTAFAGGVIPLAALGFSISCAHHLCCRFAQWEADATAWALMGTAFGALLASRLVSSAGTAYPLLIGGALPSLLVSIAGALLGSSRGTFSARSFEPTPTALPLWSDRWPTLLRAGIVAVGGGSAGVLSVWMDHLAPNPHRVGMMLSPMLLSLAIGMLAGARSKWPGLRSVGGFGAACSAAGVGVALGAAALSSSRATTATALVLACAGLTAVGFATAYGRQTLLIRVASRSSAGAIELGRLLACAGFTLLVGAPLAVRFFGPAAALMMLALSFVALGGTLIIHEPLDCPGTRRIRLWELLISMATMLLLSLLPASRTVVPTAVGTAPQTAPHTGNAGNGR